MSNYSEDLDLPPELGRHGDAEAVLAKLETAQGEASAHQYATIYAQWGDRAKALEWLQTALRLARIDNTLADDNKT